MVNGTAKIINDDLRQGGAGPHDMSIPSGIEKTKTTLLDEQTLPKTPWVEPHDAERIRTRSHGRDISA